MKNWLIWVVLMYMFVPVTGNAGVLFSEWGMPADTLMKNENNGLKNKLLKCEISCSVTANYTMFSNEMLVRYWFTSNDSATNGLKEIWMASKEKSEKSEEAMLISNTEKENLFNKLKKVYTSRFGEPNVSYRDDTMKLLGIKTYAWTDTKRQNKIQLEMWLKNVRMKYFPMKN